MSRKVLLLTNNSNGMLMYHKLVELGEQVFVSDSKLDLEYLRSMRPEWILSYNYRYIISKEIIDLYKGRIVNLHISYLPWNRGANPNFWSFVDQTPKGVTLHWMDEGLDTGDIIAQKELFFDENQESFETTYTKLNEEAVQLFLEEWPKLCERKAKSIPQTGPGSSHTVKDFKEYTAKAPIEWSRVIADYLRQNQLT